jgi:hypothetical protein
LLVPDLAQGTLDGVPVRRSLDLTSWEAANRKIRELEIYGEGKALSVREAVAQFMAERKSRRLGDAMYRKYRHATDELATSFLRLITLQDLVEMQNEWTLAPVTVQKRLELILKFFARLPEFRPHREEPHKGSRGADR